MKNPLVATVLFSMALLIAGPLLSRAGGSPDDELEARKTAPQWTWGVPTNGIVAGIHVDSKPLEHKTEYCLYVHGEFRISTNSLPPTFYSEPNSDAFPQGWFLKKVGDTNQAGIFYKATNDFCGPVVLRGSDGGEVPPRNPNLVSLKAYPKSFRRMELGDINELKAKTASRLFGRLPELARFKLEDVFEMKKPGDYVLTVWPKVYRVLRNDDDLCERIDLPPISLKINWTNGASGSIQK
jgi:hypothetical protein